MNAIAPYLPFLIGGSADLNPSTNRALKQPEVYRNRILPPEIPARVSMEAGATHGWHKYVGLAGEKIGIDRFGASAPGKVILEKFGFTAENIMPKVKKLLDRKKGPMK